MALAAPLKYEDPGSRPPRANLEIEAVAIGMHARRFDCSNAARRQPVCRPCQSVAPFSGPGIRNPKHNQQWQSEEMVERHAVTHL